MFLPKGFKLNEVSLLVSISMRIQKGEWFTSQKTTCCCHNGAKEHMYCFRKHVSGVWLFLVLSSILFWATLAFGSFFSFCLQIWCWSKSNVGLSSVLMKLASSCDIDAKIWHRLLMNSLQRIWSRSQNVEILYLINF